MTTQSYTENAGRFMQAMKNAGYDVTYMPSHVALNDFPDKEIIRQKVHKTSPPDRFEKCFESIRCSYATPSK